MSQSKNEITIGNENSVLGKIEHSQLNFKWKL